MLVSLYSLKVLVENICPQVNDVKFHPVHNTLATVGSDGRYSFWDKDARTKLKTSEPVEMPITCCAFSGEGTIFAYACSYDWSKVLTICIILALVHLL